MYGLFPQLAPSVINWKCDRISCTSHLDGHNWLASWDGTLVIAGLIVIVDAVADRKLV